MKNRVFVCSSFVFLLGLFLAASSQANVVGTDTQNFNTTTSGLDFVTVQSSDTLKPGIFNLGVFFNYAVDTLPYFEANPENRSSYNDALLGADYNLGVGLFKNWDAGISFPWVLYQYVQNSSVSGGQFSSYGNTEIRPNTKVRLVGDDTQGIALVGSVNFNQIQNNPYAGIGAGPTYNLEVAASKKFGAVGVGLNLGYRLRQPGTPIPGIPIQPFYNQIIYSGAANYLIPHTDTKAIFEVFGANATDTSNTDSDRSQASLEALLGIKHDFSTNLAFHVGMGAGLDNAIASPTFRVYTGINYTFGPLWGKDKTAVLEKETPPPEQPKQEAFVLHNILFEFNSDVLSGDYNDTLTQLVKYLQGPPVFSKLTIEGHTDSVGSEAYNINLSQRRANSIRKYLIDHFHLPAAKIESIGYGPNRPIADNGNYQGRQQNRRVEFKIER